MEMLCGADFYPDPRRDFEFKQVSKGACLTLKAHEKSGDKCLPVESSSHHSNEEPNPTWEEDLASEDHQGEKKSWACILKKGIEN